jgi:hypothetical protein
LKNSEIQYQAILERPRFDWIQNWPRLSESIYERLQPLGLRLADIKVEAVGSFADFLLTASLLNHSTLIRLRLDRVEVECYNVSAASKVLDEIVVSVLEGIKADDSQLRFSAMTSAVSLHGDVDGMSAHEFLSRFSRAGGIELGPLEGAGTALYFGESGRRTSANVTLDRSARQPGWVFVRLSAFWNASSVKPAELPGLTGDLISEAFGRLGLTIA